MLKINRILFACIALPTLTVVTGAASGELSTLNGFGLCKEWQAPVPIGQLETDWLNETSGFAVSREHNRFYFINDSGDGPSFYQTERDGSATREIEIENFEPVDTEEMALGPCPVGKGSCLAIGDIGDNRRKRSEIEVVYIAEQAIFPDRVRPVARQKLRYPDGPHNAEAFTVLPDGTLVIVTKEDKGEAKPAVVFRADIRGGANIVLTRVGEIDVPAVTRDTSFGGLVTAMAASRDGSRFTLLTYDKAIELRVDLARAPLPSVAQLKKRGDLAIVNLQVLPQQEAIAYDVNDRDLLYTTEVRLQRRLLKAANLEFNDSAAPLLRLRCKR